MPINESRSSVRGERSMSQGFVAQYAAEAALSAPGVASLDSSGIIALKESMGVEHEGKGVQVYFHDDNEGLVTITVYLWSIMEISCPRSPGRSRNLSRRTLKGTPA